MNVYQQNPETGEWEPAIPLPYYYGLIFWLWKRVTGWRDEYGRKAHLFWPWDPPRQWFVKDEEGK